MTNVIVAFSKQEDARSIKNILMRNGFQVIATCSSGAQVLACAEGLGHGIIVCGFHLPDMVGYELCQYLPEAFSFLMIASPGKWMAQIPEAMMCLTMPLKVHQLISAMDLLVEEQSKRKRSQRREPKQRDSQEQAVITSAKSVLMERNQWTEEEAHRYLQKSSMESGNNLTKTARILMCLLNSQEE